MNEIENIISYKPITEQPDLRNFSCGKSTIDDHIKEALFISKMRTSTIFEILVDGYRVGYISYRIINYPPFPIDWDSEDYQNNYTLHVNFFSAAYIEYIAIDKRFQCHGIGENTLKWFFEYTEKYLPVRYILLESTPDNVEWYGKNGFIKVDITEFNNVIMHVDLQDEEELKKMTEQLE